MLRIPGLESPGKRHRSWKTLEKSWNSEVVVLEFSISGTSIANWRRNVNVCDRAVLLLPDIKKYILAVTTGKYSKPNNMSYEVVRNNCTSDSLLCAKLKFFNSVAKQISPFLTLYQTEKPMAPFISGDLYKLLKALMKRFVKPNVMKDLTSAAKVSAVEVSSLKSESLLDYSKT